METFIYNRFQVPSIRKTPRELLDYSFDWTEWLARIDETLTGFEITTSPAGLNVVSSSSEGGIVIVFLSGGAIWNNYTVTCSITTTTPQRDGERSFILNVVPIR